ncbi:hypothetical protein FS837_009320 [Tulasnella sp. UAMH 9824]|nr:hypothetical protein FS837_009320 [Tulasnella sp. UAMH 9824]
MKDRYRPSVAETNSANVDQISWPAWGVPIEIIMKILLSVLSEIQQDTFPNGPAALKCLYKLRLVSSTWTSIVDSTPALWSFIDSSVPLNIVDVALERSKDSLLSIRVRSVLSHTLANPSLFMEKVVPHIGRWKVVDLSDISSESLPQTAALPLEGSTLNTQISPQSFGGKFESLQRLCLNRVMFTSHRYFPSFGKSLRSLTIRQPNRTYHDVTYTHIYQLLLQNPNLVEVDIQACQWSSQTENPEILADIDLPKLRSLRISGFGSYTLAHSFLLQKIKAPNCTSFELRILEPINEPSGVLWAITPFFASVVTAIPKDLKFSLIIDPDFTIAIGLSGKKFKVTLSDNCRDAGLDWVTNMLVRYRPNVACFSVSGLWTRLDEDLSELFTVIRGVTQFHVGGSMLGVWNALGRPTAPAAAGDPSQWRLPNLERLVVRSYERIDDLYECFVAAIQAREAAAVERQATGGQGGGHPRALSKVEYQSGPEGEPDKRLFDLLGDRLFVKFLE